jgi:hypothetical protein
MSAPFLRCRIAVPLAALLICPLGSQAADILIDDFSVGGMSSLYGSGSFSESISGILGGERNLNYLYAGNANANGLFLDLDASGPGLLSSATKNQIGVFTLTYNGSLDLSTASDIVVRAASDFWSMGSSFSNLSVSLTDSSGMTKSLGLTPNLAAFEFGDILFNLNNTAFSGLDTSRIEHFSLAYSSAFSADTDFDSIAIRSTTSAVSPIPEANAYLLMLLGVGLIGALARRRS